MSGTLVITHQSCPENWLAQFSLANVHKGGLKQRYFIFFKAADTLQIDSTEDTIHIVIMTNPEDLKKINVVFVPLTLPFVQHILG